MLKKFMANKQGNFTMLFGLCLFPIIGGVGLAIEYSNLSNYRAKLQNATDAGILFAGRYYDQYDRLPTNTEVESFVVSNFPYPLEDVSLDKVKRGAQAELKLEVNSTAPAFFFGKIYPEVFDQTVSATVPHGNKSLVEIAMVLDTTYSMSADNKLSTLQSVGADFIDQMDNAKNPKTKINIGIVPFANHVNVGMENRNASWIDVPADITTSTEVCRYSYLPDTRTCEVQTRYADGVPYETNVCSGGIKSTEKVCSIQPTAQKWHGCVGSRNAPFTYIDGNYANRMPGIIDDGDWHCPSALTPLTEDADKLKSAIDAFVARGDTFIAPGVMWGTRILSSKRPFKEAKSFGAMSSATTHKKFMILMTDGDNSFGADVPYSPQNWGDDTDEANDDTKTACAYARNEGIVIYSISFGTSVSAEGESVMRSCAGDDARYYSATDAKALQDAFDRIAAEITALRLSS